MTRAMHSEQSARILEKIYSGEYERVHPTGQSIVWLYYDKILNVETEEIEPYAICNKCNKTFNFAKNASTSNLKKHRCYVELQVNQNDETIVVEEDKHIKIEIIENSTTHLDGSSHSVANADLDELNETTTSSFRDSIDTFTNSRRNRSNDVRKRKPRYSKRQHDVDDSNTIPDVKPKKKLAAADEKIKDKVLNSYLQYITQDVQRVDALNGAGFRAFARSMIEIGSILGNKSFTLEDILPHSSVVSNSLHEQYANEVEILVHSLRPILENGLCAGTVDTWTDITLQNNFLTLNVHYINDDWQLQSRIFCTVDFPKYEEVNTEAITKSAENIINKLEDKFEMVSLPWNIYKLITFTTDQRPIIVKAFQDHSRINCIANILNCILNRTFEENLLHKSAPNIFETFTKSGSLVEYLKKLEIIKNIEPTMKNELLSGTNTKYDMCLYVHRHFNAIEGILTRFGELQRLQGFNKSLLDRLHMFLGLFKNLLSQLDAEKKPTIHLVLLYIHVFKEKLQNLKNAESSTELQCIVVFCLKKVFDVEFVPNRIHKIASFLWPEYKQLRYMNELEREDVYKIVREELSQMATDNNTAELSSDPLFEIVAFDGSEEDNITEDTNILNKYKDIPTKNGTKSKTQINLEMELYKNADYQDDNILVWWKENEKEFPLLAKLARKTLCIPATSKSSERCFSITNRVLEEKRSSLRVDIADATLFLHSKN